MAEKVLFCWSSGKDSAMALYELLHDPGYEVVALLTTITADYDRISMHGVRRVLVEQQAELIGLPLEKVLLNKDATNAIYEAQISEALLRYKSQGVTKVGFGDIFLEDLREYRENNLAQVGLEAVFPLWQRDTIELADTFIKRGFQAVVTCVDTQFLPAAFAGRCFDWDFIKALPAGIDPCGENGEFHSFTYAGPIFREPIEHQLGEIVLRENRFCFCDVVPEK